MLNVPVLITWEDIVDLPGVWMKIDKALDSKHVHKPKNFTVEQLGFILANEEDYILVAASKFQDNSLVSNVTRIPKGCVKSIEYLGNRLDA